MMLRETLRALFAEYKNLSVVEQMEWEGEWVPRATLEKMGIIPADEIVEVAPLKLPEEENETSDEKRGTMKRFSPRSGMGKRVVPQLR